MLVKPEDFELANSSTFPCANPFVHAMPCVRSWLGSFASVDVALTENVRPESKE